MVVGKHGMQTFGVVVDVLLLLLFLFDVFVPTSAHPSLHLDKVVCPNILKCQSSVKCLHSSMQEEDIFEHTNTKCHLISV
jgi:hypothetical protein